MITYDRRGGRTVELFIPFKVGEQEVEAITFQPVRFDDVLSWQDRKYATMLSLMAKMSGIDEAILRQIRYPDTDRVMSVFVDMLPPEIRESIASAPVESSAPAPGLEPTLGDEPARRSFMSFANMDTFTNGRDRSAETPSMQPSGDQQPRGGDDLGLGVELK